MDSLDVTRQTVSSWMTSVAMTGQTVSSWTASVVITGQTVSSWTVSAAVTGQTVSSWMTSVAMTGQTVSSWTASVVITGQTVSSWTVSAAVTGQTVSSWAVSLAMTGQTVSSWTAKNWQAWHTASIFRQLMCRPDSSSDHRPKVGLPSHSDPQPSLEASVVTTFLLCVVSRITPRLVRRDLSNGPGLIHKPESPLHGGIRDARPRM